MPTTYQATRSFFAFLFLFLSTSVHSWAQTLTPSPMVVVPQPSESLEPFVDQNKITGIEARGHWMVFRTSNGQKALDLRTGAWAYNEEVDRLHLPVAVPAKGLVPGNVESIKDQFFPEGYSVREYYTVKYADRSEHPHWILNQNWDAESNPGPDQLVDCQGGRCFDLPGGDFQKFLIRKKTAWVVGASGIVALDLETRKVTFYRTCPLFPVIKTASVGDKQYFMSEKGLYWVRDGMVVPTEAMNPHVGGLFFDLLADGPTLYMVAGSTFVVYDTQKDKMETLSTPASHTMHLLKIGDHIIGYGASLYPYEGGGGGYSGGAFSFSITGKSIKQLSNLPIVAFNPKNQAARAEETGENDDSPLTITYFKYDPEKDDLKVKLQKGPITDESTLHDHYERMQAMWNERWRDLPGMDPKTFSGMKVYYLTQSLEMGIARTRTF